MLLDLGSNTLYTRTIRVYYCRMARVTETRERRQELTEVVFRIAAECGLDGVSFREVASRAEVAVATVQYHFRTKDGMILSACEQMVEAILARMNAVGPQGTVGQVVRRVLLELLPLDEERTAEARVYLALAARAAVSPELARIHAVALAEFRANCAQAVREAQEIGEADATLDAEREASALVAFVDGLTLHVVTDAQGLPPGTAVAALDAYLGRIFDLRGEWLGNREQGTEDIDRGR